MSKLLIIGDLHMGEKGDSEKHNQQIIEMLEWCVSEFQDKVDRVVQLGDWFHNRSKIQTPTMEYAIQGAKILRDGFGKDNVLMLIGNHDLYHKNRLDVTSLRVLEPYVTLITNNIRIDDCMFAPWIVDDDQWKEVVKQSKNAKYLFAHLELSGFLMNDHYVMEHGFSHKELRDYDKVFTGHYHSYQEKDNIVYVGTPIPMSMNEANRDMGVWVLDTDTGDYAMVVYDRVKVVSVPYDSYEKVLADLDPENTSIRIEFPDDLDDETLISDASKKLEEMNFSDVKIKYKGNKAKKLLEMEVDEIEEVENIDMVVKTFINDSHEVETIDKSMLTDLYNQAIEMDDTQ